MKQPIDAWQCPMCDLVNPQERRTCVRCTFPNPYRISHPNLLRGPLPSRANARQKARRDAARHGGWGAGYCHWNGTLPGGAPDA